MYTFGIKNLVVMLIILVVGFAVFLFLNASSIDLKLNKKPEEKDIEKE